MSYRYQAFVQSLKRILVLFGSQVIFVFIRLFFYSYGLARLVVLLLRFLSAYRKFLAIALASKSVRFLSMLNLSISEKICEALK